jgi:hypothetical protein
MLGLTRIDQQDFQTSFLELLEQRDPVNSGRFHRHGFYSAVTDTPARPSGTATSIPAASGLRNAFARLESASNRQYGHYTPNQIRDAFEVYWIETSNS